MERSEEVGELIAALAKAQAEFGAATKDSDNPYYGSKYADLASVIGAVRPALAKNGIALMQFIEADLERQVASVTTALHHGEQFISITIEAPATGRLKKDENNPGAAPVKFDVQTIGACSSYLRRYTLQAICGLASEDDDGNSLQASNAPIQRRSQKVTPASVTPNPTQPAPRILDPGDEPDIRPRSQKGTSESQDQAPEPPRDPLQGQVAPEPSISDMQRKRMFAISKSAGLSTDQVKAALATVGLHCSSDMIPVSMYERAVDAIDPEMKFHTNNPR